MATAGAGGGAGAGVAPAGAGGGAGAGVAPAGVSAGPWHEILILNIVSDAPGSEDTAGTHAARSGGPNEMFMAWHHVFCSIAFTVAVRFGPPVDANNVVKISEHLVISTMR